MKRLGKILAWTVTGVLLWVVACVFGILLGFGPAGETQEARTAREATWNRLWDTPTDALSGQCQQGVNKVKYAHEQIDNLELICAIAEKKRISDAISNYRQDKILYDQYGMKPN